MNWHIARQRLLDWRGVLLVLGLAAVTGVFAGLARTVLAGTQSKGSNIEVSVSKDGAVIKTSTAEFEVLTSGYLRALLIRDGKRLTLDEPEAMGKTLSGDSLRTAGKEPNVFALDFENAKVSDAQGKLGTPGKRIEITGKSARRGLEKTLAVEVYEEFPNLALTSVTYKNVGSGSVPLGKTLLQQHRFSAALADPKAPPYRLWSFHGSSYVWGK